MTRDKVHKLNPDVVIIEKTDCNAQEQLQTKVSLILKSLKELGTIETCERNLKNQLRIVITLHE